MKHKVALRYVELVVYSEIHIITLGNSTHLKTVYFLIQQLHRNSGTVISPVTGIV